MAGQEHRGLSGGIAAADQNDVLIGAQPRLDRGRPIPDAAALEGIELFDLGPAVACAARHHDRLCPQRMTALGGERKGAGVARAIERFDRDRDQHFRAELLRLGEGAAGQRLAGNAGRKSQIVFDPRAGAGLAAIGARIQHGDR